MASTGYVWVEKYRPKIFDEIVFDPRMSEVDYQDQKKKILHLMIE